MSGKPSYTRTDISLPYGRASLVDNNKDAVMVGVNISRNGRFTIASAECMLAAEQGSAMISYSATGAACRNEGDKEDWTIGERLAAGHAIRKIGSQMVSSTMHEVTERCKHKYERPFKELTVDELQETRAMVNEEMLRRKRQAVKKEKQREKYLEELGNG